MKRKLLCLALCLCAAAMLFSGCGNRPVSGGELAVGIGSALTGEQGLGKWQTSAGDSLIGELTVGGSPVSRTGTGQYLPDRRFVKCVTETEHPDGSKTFTLELEEDVLWSDGSKLTAANYVASVLFFAEQAVLDSGASPEPGIYYVGWEEYRNTGVFSGVHLTGEYSFSVTVKAEHVPYYWEYSYLDIIPIDVSLWLPEGTGISGSSEGSRFTPDVSPQLSPESVNATRYTPEERRGLGPYVFRGVSDNMTVLERNPYYSSEDGGPYIDRLLFVETDGTAAALENGKVDMVVGVENGYADAVRLGKREDTDLACRGEDSITELIYCCDIGPTAFTAVRKAVSMLCDRASAAAYIAGEGATVPELLLGGELCGMLEKELGLSPSAPDREGAAALLEEDGWTLNAAGEIYSSGLRYKRVSEADAEGCMDAVVLADGSVLMPLRLRFACGEDEGQEKFLSELSAQGAELGMEIVSVSLDGEELANRLTRNSGAGIGYGVPLYNGFLTDVPVDMKGELSEKWTEDWRSIARGQNPTYLEDEQLCDIALEISYGARDQEEFFELLTAHTLRWRELSPELPICRGTVCDVYTSELMGYAPEGSGGFGTAILSAWLAPK